MFFLISTHFTVTPGIPSPSSALKTNSFECQPRVKPRGFHIRLIGPPTCPLHPVIPNNACTPRITAAAGTELAGASSEGTVDSADYSSAKVSSPLTGVYIPRDFILHAALLDQSFLHCPIFPTAASRRSLGRISVPVWPYTLSGRLLIVALVGCYPAN